MPALPSVPAEHAPAAAERPALVVFVDRADALWLRSLKRGFRHCFVALRQEPNVWLICDPLKDRIELTLVETVDDLALGRAYLAAGHRVCLGVTLRPALPRRTLLPSPLTCVAVVKRLIGVRAPRVQTPFQLHRHLVQHRPAPFADLSNRNLCLTLG